MKDHDVYGTSQRSAFFAAFDNRESRQSVLQFIRKYQQQDWCPSQQTASRWIRQRQRLIHTGEAGSIDGATGKKSRRGRPRKAVDSHLDDLVAQSADLQRKRLEWHAEQAGCSTATLRRRMQERKPPRPSSDSNTPRKKTAKMKSPEQPGELLSIITECDNFPFDGPDDSYYQLLLPHDDQPHGYMLPEIVQKMPWTSSFVVQHDHPRRVTVLDTSNGRNTAEAVNAALEEVVNTCIDQDLFHVFCKRHSEHMSIVSAIYDEPVRIERFAGQLFGIIHRGVHLLAYVRTRHGLKVWLSRRSPGLYTFPDMLDVSVGGGLKAGVSPFRTLLDESMEEASLTADLLDKARAAGVVSHMGVTGPDFPGEKGLVLPDFIYVYDLELPEDVKPRPHDDEVANFALMSIPELLNALRKREIKPDSSATLVDFLIRHGAITPENENDFVEICTRLHRKLPFRMRNI